MRQRPAGRRARAAPALLAVAACAALALMGCATSSGAGTGAPPDAAGTPAPTQRELDPDTVLHCQGFELRAEALTERRPVTELPTDALEALAASGTLGVGSLSAWFIADEEADRVVIMREPDAPTDLGTGDVRTFDLVAISNASQQAMPLAGSWGLNAATSCSPRIGLGGLGEVALSLDPGSPPDDATKTVALLATEFSCNSGQPATDRIEVVDVIETDASVGVVVGVRPSSEEAHDCQGNPPTPFSVELSRPLGGRVLLDAAVVPAREIDLPG